MVEIGGLMGKKKKKNREGDEGAKPHERWRGEGERELEIKACERETQRGEVRWNCKRRGILIWQYLGRVKKTLSTLTFSLYYRYIKAPMKNVRFGFCFLIIILDEGCHCV